MDDSLRKQVLAEWRRQYYPNNITYTNNQTTELTLDEVNLWIELSTPSNQESSWGYLSRYGYGLIDNKLLLLSVGS